MKKKNIFTLGIQKHNIQLYYAIKPHFVRFVLLYNTLVKSVAKYACIFFLKLISKLLTRLDLHDYWLAVLISHLPYVQQFTGITVVPGPAVHKHPGATAATVHHQAVVQVGIACIRRIQVSNSRQVPYE